jgi:hypothetical protein
MTTLTHAFAVVNLIFLDAAQVEHDDEYRPTAGPDYIPTLKDEKDYLDLLATQEARDEVMAEWWELERSQAIESALGGPLVLLHDIELAECGGFRSARYED